jgi:CO dehydrogenase/acetyl-CoA synthase alpha subunit
VRPRERGHGQQVTGLVARGSLAELAAQQAAREITLHVITETACHAGHLDAVRELIDGRQWLVVTA